MKRLNDDILEYIGGIEKVHNLCIGDDIIFVTDKGLWTYKFVNVNGKWDLESIRMKRRYSNGKHGTSRRRSSSEQKRNRWYEQNARSNN